MDKIKLVLDIATAILSIITIVVIISTWKKTPDAACETEEL